MAVAIIDALGRVTGWSEGAQQITGYTAGEIVGRPAAGLLAGELSVETADTHNGVFTLRHRDGRLVEIDVTSCPVIGSDGQPTGYVITADRPSAPEPALAELALRQAPMPMTIFDTRQRYLFLSDVVRRGRGAGEEDLVGRFFMDTVEDADHTRDFLRRLRQVVETGRPVRYDDVIGPPPVSGERAWNMEM
ncbi:hypothetical protein GCM10010121_042230 [Streptomyces brasiliensis]|uniref:PAS domain-containing protein n=1 Tax=Streptomyces brasiliensis TaxID=1954 RepID=A0A917KU50_9ACTN|nr:hypothetical protein GCM10010121_042230 [Streptomyces brasiliensis]